MLLKYAKNYIIGLGCFVVLNLVCGTNAFAYTHAQGIKTAISSSAVDSALQSIGSGENNALTTLTIAVVNDSGSNVAITSGAFRVYYVDPLTEKSTYPAPHLDPDSIACNPSDRCTGSPINAITSGTGVVLITATFTGKTLSSSYHYLIGYTAGNYGYLLKVVGSSSDVTTGSCYYDNSMSYNRPDDYGDHDAYFINKCPNVEDLYFIINGAVPPPTMIVSGSGTLDTLNNTLTFDMSGDLYVVESNYYAKIDIFSNCTRSGYASYVSQSPDVEIYAYGNECLTSTQNKGGGFYHAYEYCANTDTTTWKADEITLPHPANYSCDYPVTYCIYSTAPYQTPTIVSCGTLETISPDVSPTDTTCTTFDVGCQIKKVMTDLFSFAGVNMGDITLASSELNARVPFAYTSAVFGMDWNSPTTSGTTPPTLAFAFATGGSYVYTPNVTLTNALNLIRPVIEVALWLMLVIYFITRVRSFAQSL